MTVARRRPAHAGRALLLHALLALAPAGAAHAQGAAPDATHVVRPGDTLWDLSRTYMGTPLRWGEIQRDNAVSSPERLRPGQRLQLGAAAVALEVSGEVLLQREGREQAPLAAGAALDAGDVLLTGRDGSLAIGFGDGSRAVLPSSSAARLVAVRGGLTRIELLNGRVESYVDKQKQRDFEIRSRTFALGVKGTHFRVRAEADRSTLEVLEGDVLVTELAEARRSIDVRAGEGTALARDLPLAARALLAPPQQRLADARNVVLADPVPGAASYRLQLAKDPGFLTIALDARSPAPRFELPANLPPGFYQTRISAFDAQQLEGRAGEGVAYMASDDAPASTVQARPDGSYEIRWTPRQARHHTFELATTPDFASPLVSASGTYVGGVTVGPLEGPARYYWRCREEAARAEGDSSSNATTWGGSFEVPSR